MFQFGVFKQPSRDDSRDKSLVSTAGFSTPLVEQVKPVSLLVAVAPSKDGKEYLALSVTGASERDFFIQTRSFLFFLFAFFF